MKGFSMFVKYVIIPCSTLVGMIYGFDMYVISRARTVVEPTITKVEEIGKTVDKIDKRTMRIESILMEDQK